MMRRVAQTRILTVLAFAVAAPLHIAAAQGAEEQSSPPRLSVELNALQTVGNGCRFTFVVSNALGSELASAAFELVLFDAAGMVTRMTIVDFKDLPQGKTKVRQFDFSGVDCEDLSRVLINDATECTGETLDRRACMNGLVTETRTAITFGT